MGVANLVCTETLVECPAARMTVFPFVRGAIEFVPALCKCAVAAHPDVDQFSFQRIDLWRGISIEPPEKIKSRSVAILARVSIGPGHPRLECRQLHAI